jgi:hypothetical protein
MTSNVAIIEYDSIQDEYYIVSDLFKEAGWNPDDLIEWKEQDGLFILSKVVDKL